MKILIPFLFLLSACAHTTPESPGVPIPVEKKAAPAKPEAPKVPEEKIDVIAIDFSKGYEGKFLHVDGSNAPNVETQAVVAVKKKYASIVIKPLKNKKDLTRVVVGLEKAETVPFFDQTKPFSLSVTTFVNSKEVHSEKHLVEWKEIKGKSMNIAAFLKEGYVVSIRVMQ